MTEPDLPIIPLSTWCAADAPVIVCGPCSAETREQVMATAEGIAAMGRQIIFRSGIWKPRTRPGNFEGIGEIGLEWLREVKEKFGFLTATEVANATHVEACLKAGVDVLWIGARTTVNPFSVQEIADALKGVDVPVMIKNPIHPDISLWQGAIERISGVGIKKLAAIHRGFQHHDNYPYRNRPDWDLAIELRRRFPKLPMICDVSHISGNPALIPRLSQRAMDLGMAGLLIETHVDPPSALSDAKQQVTPPELAEIIGNLDIRSEQSGDADFEAELSTMRDRIDLIDQELIRVLGRRRAAVAEIARHKMKKGITPFQIRRWREIYAHYERLGTDVGLSANFITQLGQLIHRYSIDLQEEEMNPNGGTAQ